MVTDEIRGNERIDGDRGRSDIEHVRSGIARVDGNAARLAGASTGRCELIKVKLRGKQRVSVGNERVSIEFMGMDDMGGNGARGNGASGKRCDIDGVTRTGELAGVSESSLG